MSMFKSIVVALALLLSISCAAAQGVFRSDCTGTLVEKDEGLQLQPEVCEQYHLVLRRRLVGCKAAAWCDASFEIDKRGKWETPILERVKAACNVGDRCRVRGLVQGRGVFYWTEIASVKKLSDKR
jgi:hypothetical protein